MSYGKILESELENVNELMNNFRKDLTFNDNRYQVKLPFKQKFEGIDDNFQPRSLAKIFKNDSKLFKYYKEIIDF